LWKLIGETPWLDWLLLTKRPQNIRRMVPSEWLSRPRHNVWYGTTAETQKWLDIRAEFLVDLPAAVTFISAEPIIEKIDFHNWIGYYPVYENKVPGGAGLQGGSKGGAFNRLAGSDLEIESKKMEQMAGEDGANPLSEKESGERYRKVSPSSGDVSEIPGLCVSPPSSLEVFQRKDSS